MSKPDKPITAYHPPAEERVLPTLNADGSRRVLRPKTFVGRYFNGRRILAWGLMVLFFALPFVRINGKPAMLLDVMHREFTFFGQTFLATDGMLLALLMLSIFVGVFLLTATLGRAWCGYGCPQTVYMEFLFRPIEHLIEGGRSGTLKIDKAGGFHPRRVLKYVVFAGVAWVLANQFLAYFVGVDTLRIWVLESPSDHLGAFLVVLVTAGLILGDFAYFREQMCTVVCPYARLQSVLLDRKSLIVGYDERRGEPRKKGKARDGAGDCVDCGACVQTCPTGIDIRDGLQLECIACAQCADACDSIMAKLGKAPGLVGYTSKETIETGKASSLLRPRVLIYPVILVGLLTALVVVARSKGGADVTVLRGIGAPYVAQGDKIRNQIRVKVVNRTSSRQRYQITLEGAGQSQFVAPENPLEVDAGASRTTTVFVVSDKALFDGGRKSVTFKLNDGAGHTFERPYRLIGPGVELTGRRL